MYFSYNVCNCQIFSLCCTYLTEIIQHIWTHIEKYALSTHIQCMHYWNCAVKVFFLTNLYNYKNAYICCRVVFVLVFLLILVGTFYDVVLRYKILLEANKKNNNNITIMTGLKFLRSDGNFDHRITFSKLWSMTNHNGSLGIP